MLAPDVEAGKTANGDERDMQDATEKTTVYVETLPIDPRVAALHAMRSAGLRSANGCCRARVHVQIVTTKIRSRRSSISRRLTASSCRRRSHRSPLRARPTAGTSAPRTCCRNERRHISVPLPHQASAIEYGQNTDKHTKGAGTMIPKPLILMVAGPHSPISNTLRFEVDLV